MRGLWLEDRQLTLRGDLPEPVPGPGECLIRPILRGICSTDHQLVQGLYPYTGIPGHEFVGVVASGPTDLLGRTVVAEINLACGHCARCLAGLTKHCANRRVIGIRDRPGAFAERLAVPIANLHLVPDSVSPAQAVFTEPLAAALDIQEQMYIGPDDRVLVVGDGKLGQLIAQSLRPTGCRLTVLGRHPPKLAHLERLGIATRCQPDPPPTDCDSVIECTGSTAGFALARQAVRPRGTLVLKSTYQGTAAIDLSAIVVDEIRILGSRCGPFPAALALLASGRIDLDYLIDSVYPLAAGLTAFARSRERGVLKVLIGERDTWG
ncbi:alcohol dehydrogenase catalytic domain-containing protein [uncultured Lamprocystis sp.]|jgi:threonine dehydrogenase-like Zn-dependent dehydrogenase|uniref:MDR/zinc-dependent alcohol dehydrogenase-like family protein n=1 Tax=uncultured Lamprocystis sp. TaxID=543132 RepID=UPI0025F00070|nr:alcohol dehydrogenase catalytic domain-containing protein [uncultured Lamprocystis sp.]